MPPGEALVAVVSVVSLFIGMPWVIFSGVRSLRSQKRAARDQDLTMTELRAMIRETVDEAVAPLSARVADLEDRLGDESVADLRTRLDPDAIAQAFEAGDEDSEARPPARERVR